MTDDKKEETNKESESPTDDGFNKALDVAPPEVVEALKNAPPQVRKIITEMGMFQATGAMSPIHPLFTKFSPGHIDKFLDYSHKDDENIYKLQSSNRWFYLAYASMAVIFLIFLVIFLSRDNQGLLSDILKVLAVFAGGFGSGFGVKSHLEKRK